MWLRSHSHTSPLQAAAALEDFFASEAPLCTSFELSGHLVFGFLKATLTEYLKLMVCQGRDQNPYNLQ